MAHLLEHTSISDPPPEAPGSSFPGQTKHLPELGTLSRPAVSLPHQSLPSLRTLGVHFVDIFHPPPPSATSMFFTVSFGLETGPFLCY